MKGEIRQKCSDVSLIFSAAGIPLRTAAQDIVFSILYVFMGEAPALFK